MKCFVAFFISLIVFTSLGHIDLLRGSWDDDLIYRGGNVDYLLARPDTGEVRIYGGGLEEWVQKFKAGGFDNGPNGIPENGGGDDIFLGVLTQGVTWETSVPPSVGKIKPTNGIFRSSDQTGEGPVTASYTGATPVSVWVRVYPPDWVPGSGMIRDDDKRSTSPTSPMGIPVASAEASLQVRNYPNPFNPSTTFSYRVPDGNTGQVSLEIYSLRGQRVATLVDGFQTPGEYQIQWSGVDDRGEKVSSGIYLYKLQVDRKMVIRKMTVLK